MTQKKMTPYEEVRMIFLKRWDEIDLAVEYNRDWEIPMKPDHRLHAIKAKCVTYTLMGLVDDPQFTFLPYGTLIKSMDDHGRKVIAVTSRLGVIVLHDVSLDSRMTHILSASPNRVILAGWAGTPRNKRDIWNMIGSGPCQPDQNGKVFQSRNIGQRMEDIRKMLDDPQYDLDDHLFYFEEITGG